jgi:hypothetical protein
MESSASSEAPMRLKAYPKMQEALDTLPPKLLLLSSDEPTKKVDLKEESLEGRVERVVSRIERAHFIGKADKPVVIATYKDYVSRMASSLQEALPLLLSAVGEVSAEESTQILTVQPLPAVSTPPAGPLRLAVGQILLVLAGGEGGTRFGVVGESGRVLLTLAGGEAELAYDACVQAVLPWRPEATYPEGFLRHVEALPASMPRSPSL